MFWLDIFNFFSRLGALLIECFDLVFAVSRGDFPDALEAIWYMARTLFDF